MHELEEIAAETSDAERRAAGAERELIDWKTAQFMENTSATNTKALIISVQKFGFFVELIEVFVEGLVPINRLEEQTGDAVSIATRITPSSRSAAAVAALSNGISAIAFASSRNASIPFAAVSNSLSQNNFHFAASSAFFIASSVNESESRGMLVTNGPTIHPSPVGISRVSEIDSHCTYTPPSRAKNLQ